MALIDPAPWDEDARYWDTLELGGVEWPGLAVVDIQRSNKWDTKKAKGSHGGEREFNGADLAKVKIQLRAWTSEQLATIFADCLPLVEPTPGKEKLDAVALGHPVAAFRKVSQVTIDSISGPRIQERMAVWDIDATEYRPPETKNASGTASGKGAGGNFNPKNTSNCDDIAFQIRVANDTISALSAQRNALEQELALGQIDWFAEPGEPGSGAHKQAQIAAIEAQQIDLVNQQAGLLNQQATLQCYAAAPSGDPATTNP